MGDWELSVTRDLVSPEAEKTQKSRKSKRDRVFKKKKVRTKLQEGAWKFIMVIKAVNFFFFLGWGLRENKTNNDFCYINFTAVYIWYH